MNFTCLNEKSKGLRFWSWLLSWHCSKFKRFLPLVLNRSYHWTKWFTHAFDKKSPVVPTYSSSKHFRTSHKKRNPLERNSPYLQATLPLLKELTINDNEGTWQ